MQNCPPPISSLFGGVAPRARTARVTLSNARARRDRGGVARIFGPRRYFLHGVTPRSHGPPPCFPCPRLLYCVHGPRSPSSLVCCCDFRDGAERPFCAQNACVTRFSRPRRDRMRPPRRRRCGALQGMKKGRRPRRRPHLNFDDRTRDNPARSCAQSRMNSGFSRGFPSRPGLSRVSQIRCPRTRGFRGR